MPVRAACLGVPLLDPLCQGASGAGSSLVGSGASAVLDAMARWVSTGSTWLLTQIGHALTSSTSVSLSAPWFLSQFRSMEGLLGLLALPLLLLASLQALASQRPGLLLRAVFVQLPLAMILAGGAVQLSAMALRMTDELCQSISSAQPGALASVTASLSNALTGSGIAGSAMPSFILLLLAALAVVAGIILWVELLLRSAAIYVGVLFLPLALACSIWPALNSWVRRLVEVLASLILSKLVVVVVLCAAAGALGTSSGRGVATIMTGIALLFLAAFAPFTLLRLLPFFESSAALHLEGLRHRSVGALTTGLPSRGASLAVQAVRQGAPPPLHPALRAAASTDPLRPGGPRTSDSPMLQSAIENVESLHPAPLRPPTGGRSPVGPAGRPPPPTRWPGPTVPPSPGPSKQSSSAPALTGLVIERDQFGPRIVARPRPEDE